MTNTLLITGGEKGRKALVEVLSGMQLMPIETATSGGQARRLLTENDYDIVVLNAPLPDEFGNELAVYIAEHSGTGVVLLARAEVADEVASRVEDAGVFVVPKPLNRSLLFGAIKLALAARRRLNHLQKKNDQLQQKIDDIRLVDRAKCALIQYRQLTEPQAHKYIEQVAMDERKTRREVAQSILHTFEG